jgi:dipeptidyl aminopeptidase/acylaminoacyl peptidase
MIHRDWGGGDLEDLRASADWLRGQEWVDAERLGVYGGSYGGFAVLSCTTRLPEYWAVAVDIFGPSNLVTAARSVPPTWRRFVASWIGDPDTEEEFLLSRSPLTYIEDLRAPLLVIQGANDPRVVKAESDQIVERLRELGRTVEYEVFEDEGHGFTRKANELRAYRLAADWLERHLATPATANL